MSELLAYRYITTLIDGLEDKLRELQQDRCGKQSSCGHCGGTSDNTALLATQIADIELRIKTLTNKQIAVESYIGAINDKALRYCFVARFINGIPYPAIAKDLRRHKVKVSADSVRKRVRAYVTKNG